MCHRWVCRYMCECANAYLPAGNLGVVGQDSPGRAVATMTAQLSMSDCTDLKQEPFCGIYDLLLRKKLLEWPQLSGQLSLCPPCQAKLPNLLPPGARVQGLWHLLGSELSPPQPWALLKLRTGQSLTEEAADRQHWGRKEETRAIRAAETKVGAQWWGSEAETHWREVKTVPPLDIPCASIAAGLFPSFVYPIRMIWDLKEKDVHRI